MATQININRLDDIHTEMEKLNREARRIITDAVGHSHIVAVRSADWHNNIKYALSRDTPFQNTSLRDTLAEIQEMINSGELDDEEDEDEE